MLEDVFRDLPEIATERLLLRKLRPDDAADMFAYAGDPEVARYTTWDPHGTVRDSATFIARALERYASGLPASWAVVDRADGRMVGTCGFLLWSRRDNRGEIGYALARDRWGRGYMTEAVRAVVGFGFERLGLNRIEATCDDANPASARVLEKIGMRLEGTLRECAFLKGTYHDLRLYAVLRREWPGRS